MISIFTTKENLESIVLDKNNQPWLAMIRKLKRVFINEDISYSDDEDADDNIFIILDRMQIDVDSTKKEYINGIQQNPVCVLSQPFGIFLLDIPIEKASQIQNDYGVICQSVSKMDYTPFSQPHHPTELYEGECCKSWEDIIAQYKQLPSNSVLIVDAHLFDEDYFDNRKNCYDLERCNGKNNVMEILNNILPMRFEGVYHVGIITTDIDIAKNKGRSRSNLTNKQITDAINKLKKKLNRKFDINIEVFFFNPNVDDAKKAIHNRQIISNYFIVTALYKLAALNNGKSLCQQSIGVYPLFENIDVDPDSDKKEKRIRIDIEQIKHYFHLQTKEPIFRLYKDGDQIFDYKQIKHRFFQ